MEKETDVAVSEETVRIRKELFELAIRAEQLVRARDAVLAEMSDDPTSPFEPEGRFREIMDVGIFDVMGDLRRTVQHLDDSESDDLEQERRRKSWKGA